MFWAPSLNLSHIFSWKLLNYFLPELSKRFYEWPRLLWVSSRCGTAVKCTPSNQEVVDSNPARYSSSSAFLPRSFQWSYPEFCRWLTFNKIIFHVIVVQQKVASPFLSQCGQSFFFFSNCFFIYFLFYFYFMIVVVTFASTLAKL